MGEPLSAETQARVNQLMPSHAGGGSVPFNPVVLQPPVSPAFTFAQQPSQQQPARAPVLYPELPPLNLPLSIKVYGGFNEKFTSSNRRHNREVN